MSEKPFQQLRGLVVDWAGTVIDHGSRAPAIVFQEIFRQSGVDITFAEARGPMGLSKRAHIAAVVNLPRVAEAWEAVQGRPATSEDVDDMYARFLPLQKVTLKDHSELIDGIAETVRQLRQRGLSIGSTTGYTEELMDVVKPLAAQQGLVPDVVVCSDHVQEGRPAPWMLSRAAEALDVYPLWRVVKVDDTVPGIAAARNAGAWAVGVSRTGNEVGLSEEEWAAAGPGEQTKLLDRAEQILRQSGAEYVVGSVAEIVPVLEDIEGRLERGERPPCKDSRDPA
ncbi:MAG: phosphonoacetaldehyde hydrolase [Myxococcota bacterium]|nr:phosphonoacetaldehyde hydrolase [Myxococcota bacterium]